ncbi:UDP-glucose pyrophosphorylase 2 [Fasciolopsis buskii]|uniref:UTP--glucose-1-phosphate uridylyltransferase n=1 Tax=Fasciolopsis buskii TaxID=27845 RepID=A0A8E0RUB2_9TREM|nr:UDP-glucose pyrophosphorylase 2 [Fasciolopsis buski]
MDGFQQLFERYLHSTSETFDWKSMEPIPTECMKSYYDLAPPADRATIQAQLNKLVVVKLNGGLGTTMGCTGPKSLISVRNDLTFLDLNVQQIEVLNNNYGTSIPLVLMNSFNTNADTEKVLRKYQQVNVEIVTFMQSMYPRLNRESLLPLAKNAFVPRSNRSSPSEGKNSRVDMGEWYPPGHGDFYRRFVESGLAEKYVAAGKEWIFLANIDNLGATVDLNILNFLITSNPKPEFVMEVTDKTRADVKGGTLTKYHGHLRLLELAQVPKDHVDEFSSVRTFRIFNTNNLWINLPAMYEAVKAKTLQMEIIVNPKTLDSGLNILQLEQAAGAAIKSFNVAYGLNVPRSRFLPVKTTSDLLLVMSNLYVLDAGHLTLSPLRSFPSVPLVKLGSHFKKVKDFLMRFSSIPDMLELDHLTVTGDVYFGKNITLKGTVIIIANFGSLINMPSGSFLENKIVSGNLRILDH